MRATRIAAGATGAFALALCFGAAAPPAGAGPVCAELDLPNNCVRSNDLRARINLREAGRDGRLQIRDADNETAVSLDGSSANLTNLFSNLEDESNGLVKAWARINADGTIAACWRCNTDPNETRLITGSPGAYEVDFTPLDTDITGRPRSGTIDSSFAGIIGLEDRTGDDSSVFVQTANQTGTNSNQGFVVIIY